MAQYRNKGWPYLEKFIDMFPNTTARGANAFSAMRAAPPIPLNDSDTLNDPIADEISTNDSAGNTLINPMDTDRHTSDTTSIFTSNSVGKRKLDVIASDEELNISGDPVPSSKPSSTAAEMPAKKKASSLPMSLPTRSKATSSTHSSQARAQTSTGTKKTSTKITPALLAHEIQGSINSLASAVRESGLTDPVAKLRQDAIHHVSDGDDGLSGEDLLDIIDLFRKDYAAVQTYMALLNHNNLRKGWLEKQLKELKD